MSVFTGLKWAVQWFFGDYVRTWRTALWATGMAAFFLLKPIFESWLVWLFLQLPAGLAADFLPYLYYLKVLNYFVPLKEFLIIYVAYGAWRISLLAVLLVRWFWGWIVG